MKVLMVATWYSPKNAKTLTAGVFHYEQSMALKPYCETALYYPYDENLPVPFEKGVERDLMIYRRRKASSPIPKADVFLRLTHMFSDLKRICKEFHPDVLHAHCGFPTGAIVALFGKLHGYPVVITEHSPMEQMPLECKRVWMSMHYAYSHSDANVCVSINSMERLQEHFPDCHYQVIYNGVYDPKDIPRDGNTYRVPGKLNCCIVAAFYSKDIKGYQYLLPAIAQLKKMGKQVVLHICGGGDYFEHFKDMAAQLDILDCCIFYGNCPKDKVYSIVSQMDFNISASLFECSGVSVEEALLLGKPMLVTRSGGANSLVTDDVAIVVDKGSTQALVDGILEMEKRLPEFSQKEIYNYALNNFEIDHVSRQYMELYRKIQKK